MYEGNNSRSNIYYLLLTTYYILLNTKSEDIQNDNNS